MVSQTSRDGVSAGLHQKPIEGIALLKRQVTHREHACAISQGVETRNGERGDDDRLTFFDVERNVDVFGRTMDDGVDYGVVVTAPLIQNAQPNDVAPELLRVKISLCTEAQPPHHQATSEPAGVRGRNATGQDFVRNGLIAPEIQLPHYELRLLAQECCRVGECHQHPDGPEPPGHPQDAG